MQIDRHGATVLHTAQPIEHMHPYRLQGNQQLEDFKLVADPVFQGNVDGG